MSGRKVSRRGMIVGLSVAPLVLAGCSKSEAGMGNAAMDALEIAGLGTVEAIDKLEQMPLDGRNSDARASVRPRELLVSVNGGEETSLPIPDGKFYVSIAPFVDATHECHFHSLTTCTGELGGKDIKVLVKDGAATVLSETRTAAPNGFIGLWVPAGRVLSVVTEYRGLTAKAVVDTASADAATCVTTMKLA